MSQSDHCAHTFPSQRSPHRRAYHSPVFPSQPVRLHPIPRSPPAFCSPQPLALRHAIEAPLNRREALIPPSRPESLQKTLLWSSEQSPSCRMLKLSPLVGPPSVPTSITL